MAKPKLQKTVQFILPQLRRLHMHGEARAASFMKPLNLVLMHSCPKITTVYQVVKGGHKWYEIVRVEKQYLPSGSVVNLICLSYKVTRQLVL